jgi:hypothetical protein
MMACIAQIYVGIGSGRVRQKSALAVLFGRQK